ncbi:glycoside hydrolase family 104 protein [Comamonas antarctica]|uniref:glycoside hydrolase family 24 protein n=1 Tax=Comamonas antarctica TaxID=2743470 RepID=UPI0028E9E976|nr:glycoside hydrolase family 104 protein [Comamonas antarctica]
MQTIEELKAALGDSNTQRYLRMIQQAEGTYKGAEGNPYATAFGGGHIADLSRHPKQLHSFTQTDGKPNKTSAAGAYQFLGSTWDDVAGKLALPDFGQQSQDLAALELMRRNGSLPDVLAGRFDQAVKKDGKTWASLPSSPYAQPRRSPGFIEKALTAALPGAQAGTLPPAGAGSHAGGAPTGGAGGPNRAAFEQAMAQYRAQQQGQAQPMAGPQSNGATAAPADAQRQVVPAAPATATTAQGGADPRAAFAQAMQQFQASQKGAPAAKPKRSLAADLRRQLGLTARHALEGVGQTADIVAGPANSLLRLTGVQATNPSQSASQLSDWMGLPKPEGKLENIVGGAARTMAGVGGFAGGAAGLANAATNATAKASLGSLAAQPALQLVSGATGGGASEMARQNGAGVGGQVLAGVAGALAPSTLSGLRAGTQQAFRGPQMPEMHQQAVRNAVESGYKLPPSQAKPSAARRALDGLVDNAKLKADLTLKNQQATNDLARRAIGLPDGSELSPQLLANLRQQAGQQYDTVRGLGMLKADKAYRQDLQTLGRQYANTKNSFPGLVKDNGVADILKGANVKQMDASSVVDAIRTLRESASTSFANGNQPAGRTARQTATALENLLERNLAGKASPDTIQAFRDARQQIARIHELERVLTPAGNVDAKALGATLKRGKPLSGEIRRIAEAGATFPSVMRTAEQVGAAPSVGFLDAVVPAAFGLTTGNWGALGLMAARPGMRGLLASDTVQRGLLAPTRAVKPAVGGSSGLLALPHSTAGTR